METMSIDGLMLLKISFKFNIEFGKTFTGWHYNFMYSFDGIESAINPSRPLHF